jgi:hypothetical protein
MPDLKKIKFLYDSIYKHTYALRKIERTVLSQSPSRQTWSLSGEPGHKG